MNPKAPIYIFGRFGPVTHAPESNPPIVNFDKIPDNRQKVSLF